MASSLGDLFVKIGLTGLPEFQASMNGISGSLSKAVSDADKTARGFDKLGSSLTSMGSTLTAALTLPIAGVGIAATKMASDFELGMRKVGSLVGGLADTEFRNLERSTLDLAKAMGIDAVKATDALYQAISAGVPKENALDFIRVASVAAIAGLTDTNVAVDALTTVLAAYGLKTSEAKAVSDAMFQAVNIGKFEFKDLAAAIGPAAQQADNLGISYTELLASTATLSLTSGGVSNAVTQIESAMRSLLNPTKEMEAALLKIGFTSGEAAVKSLGFEGTLQKLRETSGASAAEFNALFGRIEGATGALGLTGEKAVKAATDYETMRHATDGLGAATVAYNEINKSTSRQFDILTNNLKTAAIELGVELLPYVNRLLESGPGFIKWIEDSVKWFSELPAPVRDVSIAFAATLAVLGPLTVGLGLVFSSIGSLISGFGALSGAMGALSFGSLTTAVSNIATAISGNMIGALTSGEMMLLRFGQAGLLAAAAFTGWAIGKWLGEMKPVQEFFDSMLVTVPAYEALVLKVAGVGGKLKEANDDFAGSIKMLEDRLKAHGVVIDKTGLSMEEYSVKLRDAVKALTTTGTSATTTAKAVASTGTSAEAAAVAHKKLVEALDAAEKNVTELRKAYAIHAASAADVAKAEDKVNDILLKLHPNWKIQAADMKLVEAALKSAESALADTKKGYENHVRTAQDVAEAEDRVRRILLQLHPEWKIEESSIKGVTETAAELEKRMEALGEQLIRVDASTAELGGKTLPDFGVSASAAQMATMKLETAFTTLGMASQKELAELAAKAKDAYETIANSGTASASQIREAQIIALQDQMAAWAAAGKSIPADQQIMLAKLQQQEQDYVGTSLTRWKDLYGKIHDTVSGMFDGLIKDLFEGGDFLQTITKTFQRIGEDMVSTILKPFTDKFENWIADKLTSLLGSALDTVFGTGGILGTGIGAGTNAAGGVAGAAGSAGSAAGSAAGGVASAAGSIAGGVLGIVNGVTGVISAVTGILALFGVGQGGQKDRLGNISDATVSMARMMDAGGGAMNMAILDIRNDSKYFLGAFTTWYANLINWIADRITDVNTDMRAAKEYLGEIAAWSTSINAIALAVTQSKEKPAGIASINTEDQGAGIVGNLLDSIIERTSGIIEDLANSLKNIGNVARLSGLSLDGFADQFAKFSAQIAEFQDAAFGGISRALSQTQVAVADLVDATFQRLINALKYSITAIDGMTLALSDLAAAFDVNIRAARENLASLVATINQKQIAMMSDFQGVVIDLANSLTNLRSDAGLSGLALDGIGNQLEKFSGQAIATQDVLLGLTASLEYGAEVGSGMTTAMRDLGTALNVGIQTTREYIAASAESAIALAATRSKEKPAGISGGINITIQGNVIGTRENIEQLSEAIATEMRLQGAFA